jgi:hypothetical protein
VRKLQTAEFLTKMHCQGRVLPSVSCGIFQMTAECVSNFYISLTIRARAIQVHKKPPLLYPTATAKITLQDVELLTCIHKSRNLNFIHNNSNSASLFCDVLIGYSEQL